MKRRQFLRISPGILLLLSQSGTAFGANSKQRDGTGFVYDPVMLEHWLEPGHPESPQRLKSIMAAMHQSGLDKKVSLFAPLPDAESYLPLIHTQYHIAGIKADYSRSYKAGIACVGAALAGVRAVSTGMVRNAFCAVRPPGHHARNTGREEGFCLFNAVSIAARYAQQVMRLTRVLIIDWDYHHGDGTEMFFYTDPTVLYFSTHDLHAYPGTGDPARTGAGSGKGYNINVALDCNTGDDVFVRVFEEKLLPAALKFKPEIILISAGFDSRKDDLLGCFALTDEGYMRLTRLVMQLAHACCDGRIVSVLEGGYNLEGLASGVVQHVRALLEV